MLKVKYIDGTVEEFKADDWEISEECTELTRKKDGEEETVAVVFNRNVLSIQ